MANSTPACPKKAKIDQKAQTAIDAADSVLQNNNAAPADLRKALQLTSDTLKVIKSDPHNL